MSIATRLSRKLPTTTVTVHMDYLDPDLDDIFAIIGTFTHVGLNFEPEDDTFCGFEAMDGDFVLVEGNAQVGDFLVMGEHAMGPGQMSFPVLQVFDVEDYYEPDTNYRERTYQVRDAVGDTGRIAANEFIMALRER